MIFIVLLRLFAAIGVLAVLLIGIGFLFKLNDAAVNANELRKLKEANQKLSEENKVLLEDLVYQENIRNQNQPSSHFLIR